ncbi:hypothetical protein JCM14036_02960 [Desulfotomaculum defluvii]
MEDIDKNIAPLINSMNACGWITTTSCCEGHYGGKYHNNLYIQFFCRSSKINRLAEVLNEIQSNGDSVFIDVSFVFEEDTHACQDDAPKGYIALFLTAEDDEGFKDIDKKIKWITMATEEFSKLKP